MTDLRQTPRYAKYLEKIGWKVEPVNDTYYFIKKIPLIGSVIKIQRPEEIKIKKINELAKKYRAFQIIIEPKTEIDARYLTSVSFRLSKGPYLPTKTLQLDLTQSKEELFSQLKKDAKYALRKIQDSKFKIQNLEDIEKFREQWKKAVGFKRYVPPISHLKALKKTFDKNALFLATKDGSAGAIFLLGDKIDLGRQAATPAYYWQAFSSKEGRKNLAQYRIVWEAISWAKSRGAKVFDFEGIYDERFPNKSWHGFTHFKKSFGGYEVEYPGAYKRNLFTIRPAH